MNKYGKQPYLIEERSVAKKKIKRVASKNTPRLLEHFAACTMVIAARRFEFREDLQEQKLTEPQRVNPEPVLKLKLKQRS